MPTVVTRLTCSKYCRIAWESFGKLLCGRIDSSSLDTSIFDTTSVQLPAWEVGTSLLSTSYLMSFRIGKTASKLGFKAEEDEINMMWVLYARCAAAFAETF